MGLKKINGSVIFFGISLDIPNMDQYPQDKYHSDSLNLI